MIQISRSTNELGITTFQAFDGDKLYVLQPAQHRLEALGMHTIAQIINEIIDQGITDIIKFMVTAELKLRELA